MRINKPLAILVLSFGTAFGIGIFAYTIDRFGGFPKLPMTIGQDLSDVYVEKAGLENPLVTPVASMSSTGDIKRYEPTYSEIAAYIKRINAEVVRQGVGPELTDAQIRRIILSIERHCVTYGVNKYTIVAMITVESSFIIRIPSHLGEKYGRGLLQVSEIALKDFNEWTSKNYTVEDLYTIDRNIEVGVWAFNQNYYYGVETDFEHGAIIAYNVGANDYKKHKKDLLDQTFKGYGYDYLVKVQKEYDAIIGRAD